MSFSWTQYTPYFNDGEPCTFSCNSAYPFLKFDGDEYPDEYGTYNLKENEDGTFTRHYGNSPVTEKDIIGYRVAKFLEQFDADVLESMFGDHVKVVVHRDGRVEQEDYDHE